MVSLNVQGFCPMGCGRTLYRNVYGRISCAYSKCPEPLAVDTILSVAETEHIVTLTANDYTIKHPLRERLGDALLTCGLGSWLNSFAKPPNKPGTYRAVAQQVDYWKPPGNTWQFTALEEGADAQH